MFVTFIIHITEIIQSICFYFLDKLDNLIKYYYRLSESDLKDTHYMIKKLYMVLFVDIHALNLLNIDYIGYLIQKNIN